MISPKNARKVKQNFYYPTAFFALIFLLFLPETCRSDTHNRQKNYGENHECVMLIHGMGRTARSMNNLAKALENQGYRTLNLVYSSRKKTVEQIVADEFQRGLEICQSGKPRAIHFVSHSLGGIIVRAAFQVEIPENLGKVVMLSPPNQGSEVTDRLKNRYFYRFIFGKAGQQLGTDKKSLPLQLGPATYPVGIITGNRYSLFDYSFSKLIPGKDDGKVSIQRAKLEGMKDFLIVNESHPFIMNSSFVIDQVLFFLDQGTFNHKSHPPASSKIVNFFSRESN